MITDMLDPDIECKPDSIQCLPPREIEVFKRLAEGKQALA